MSGAVAIWTALFVLAGVIVSAFVTYWGVRRQNSGNISTSDAASLWAESNALRSEYRERAKSLEVQLESVNRQLQSVLDELSELKVSSAAMIEKIDELKQTIANLQAENTQLLKLKGNEIKV